MSCYKENLMPLRQAVRPRILIPVFAGSNPAGVVSCGCGVEANISAFQAEVGGSIPLTRFLSFSYLLCVERTLISKCDFGFPPRANVGGKWMCG